LSISIVATVDAAVTTILRVRRVVVVILVVATRIRPVVRLAVWALAAVLLDETAKLNHLLCKLSGRVYDGLVREDHADRIGLHKGKMDLFAIRSELVVGVDEAEEVQDHTGVTHVEAESEVCTIHGDTPTLRTFRSSLCGSVTTRSHRRSSSSRSDRALRLAVEDCFHHLLRKVAEHRRSSSSTAVLLLTVVLRIQGSLSGSRRAGTDWEANRGTRDLDGRHSSRLAVSLIC
jgi:hypothetical protein